MSAWCRTLEPKQRGGEPPLDAQGQQDQGGQQGDVPDLAEYEHVEQPQQQAVGAAAQGVVEDPAPAPDELAERGVHAAGDDPADQGDADPESLLLHPSRQRDVLDEAVLDGLVAARGVVRRAPDQDVLAVGEGERRGIAMDDLERERLHQHDPAQRLHDPLPEGLAPQLGQQAHERGVVSARVLHHDGQALGCVQRIGVEEPEPLPGAMPAAR